MINLRIGRQTYNFDCGAKALQLVMEYFGVEMREDELMKELSTDKKEGTSYVNMKSLAEEKGFTVFASTGVSLEKVKDYLDHGYPVIVALQAWADRYMTLDDWKSTYDYGHYAIVIGYEDRIVIFEDPSSIHRTWMSEEEFLARWHDGNTREKVDNFAMVLMGKKPAEKIPEHMD